MAQPKVQIAKRVLTRAARVREQDGAEWALDLLLAPAGDADHARAALAGVLGEVTDAWEAEHDGVPEAPFVGEWSAARVRAGVRVHVTECDAFAAILPRIAAGLEAHGVGGKLDLHRPVPGVRLPHHAAMVGCRLRVRGRRVRRDAGSYAWEPDAGALRALVTAADRWCRGDDDAEAATALSVDAAGPLALEVGEPVVDRLLDAAGALWSPSVVAVRGDAFRGVQVAALGTGVHLVIDAADWRAAVAGLAAFVREHAGDVACAYVRGGWDVAGHLGNPAKIGDDWPQRPDDRPRGPGATAESFDDLLLCDAFPVLLLGPGHVARVRDLAGWCVEELAGGSVLLTPTDLDAWFGEAPAVPIGTLVRPEERPVPPVLGGARADLAPLLYAPGALRAFGFDDVA